LPILSRAASLRWTHDAEEWFFISQDWQRLSQGTDPGTQDLRREIKDLLTSDLPLRDRAGSLRVTDIQRRSLNAWAAGNFVDDWQPTPPAPTLTPENLDRTPLEASVGGGFFPGIEAGRGMRNNGIYMEPYRLRQDMPPGFITEEMALPWQSDFWQCSGAWWPAQRPDLAHQRSNPDASPLRWTKDIITLPTGAGAERQMVERFAKLGYIKPVTLPDGQVVHVEDERDPAFPRPSLV
jgi:hypothetical protein